MLRTIILVGCDDSIVGPHFEHVLTGLARSPIDGKSVLVMIDGAPIGELGFERSLDFPILDKVFDETWQAAICVVGLFGYSIISTVGPV